MVTYWLDWTGLLVRWLHVVAGIAWIGASFYFVWLDNHLVPLTSADADPNVAGELWAVHGGGFYRSQKYRIAPPSLPSTLHWFYWEAYTTWLSGFALLCLLYFGQAEAYLIDPAVLVLSKTQAIGIALAVLLCVWLVYDAICRSRLAGRPRTLATLLGLLLGLQAWALTQVFSGRGAFMVFGASLGTLMVANVFFVIIPGQRELVLAKQQGREPDAGPGLKGKQRSVHNTYFTLPVLFVMISNHYAMTYGAHYNWAVLIAMSFAGACIRAWFVARHRPAQQGRIVAALPACLAAATLAVLVVTLTPPPLVSPVAGGPTVDPGRVEAILTSRCAPCHAVNPTQAGFSAPPNGIVLQRLDQLQAHEREVLQQLATHAMPLGNLTGMTEPERATMIAWIGERGKP